MDLFRDRCSASRGESDGIENRLGRCWQRASEREAHTQQLAISEPPMILDLASEQRLLRFGAFINCT
ncbi:hypothetical protein DL98DRAFT_519139 [Cadophora sp. DSE1049]|nr:hypothetical protein DL98DRAFT_519139 [Cadophora sp. DSE1049]